MSSDPRVGANAVAALDLVGVRDVLAREHAGVGSQPADLISEPAAALLVEIRGRDDGLRQGVRVGREIAGIDQRLRGDRGRELGRPVVRVDEAVDVPAEPEPEGQVALDHVGHAARAA